MSIFMHIYIYICLEDSIWLFPYLATLQGAVALPRKTKFICWAWVVRGFKKALSVQLTVPSQHQLWNVGFHRGNKVTRFGRQARDPEAEARLGLLARSLGGNTHSGGKAVLFSLASTVAWPERLFFASQFPCSNHVGACRSAEVEASGAASGAEASAGGGRGDRGRGDTRAWTPRRQARRGEVGARDQAGPPREGRQDHVPGAHLLVLLAHQGTPDRGVLPRFRVEGWGHEDHARVEADACWTTH